MKKFILKMFIKKINPDIKVLFGEYNETEDNTIYINPTEYICPGFKSHLKEKHKCNFVDKYNQLTWSILHEIGHIMTHPNDELEDLVRLTFETQIEEEDYNTDINLQYSYYDLQSEYLATEWAKEYIELHPLRCKIYNKIFKGVF